MNIKIGPEGEAIKLAMELQKARALMTIAHRNLIKYGDHLIDCKKRPAGTDCTCGFHEVYLRAATVPAWPTQAPPVC